MFQRYVYFEEYFSNENSLFIKWIIKNWNISEKYILDLIDRFISIAIWKRWLNSVNCDLIDFGALNNTLQIFLLENSKFTNIWRSVRSRKYISNNAKFASYEAKN